MYAPHTGGGGTDDQSTGPGASLQGGEGSHGHRLADGQGGGAINPWRGPGSMY